MCIRDRVQPGDRICVRTGGMIPLDSVVDQGEVTVNQASLTGCLLYTSRCV